MTVSTTISRWEATGNGSTTVFPYNNKIFAETDLRVYLDGALQTLTTHYTVSGAGAEAGGNVTFVTAPGVGVGVAIVRSVANTQEVDFPPGGSFPSVSTEDAVDRRTIISQQHASILSRTLQYPEYEIGLPSGVLPSAADRADRLLGFDTNGHVTPLAKSVAGVTVPWGLKTPYDYGAVPGEEWSADNSAAVQALMDAWTASWSASLQAFGIVPFFAGAMFRCDSEIFLNETRQPGGVIFGGGGGIYSKNANGVVLNALGTNQLAIKDLQIYGDDDGDAPDVGIAYGYTDSSGVSPGVHLVNCITRGYFNKSAVVNFSSEVGSHIGCYFENKSPVRTARAFYWAQSVASFDADCTGGSATFQDSLDVGGNSTALTTVKSNLGHVAIACDYKRTSPKSIEITGIDKTNPALVRFASGALASSGWSNGTELSLHSVTGMTEIEAGIHTIQNIDTVNDTLELAGVDATGYSTFASGRAWQATGPAFTIAGAAMVEMRGCYALAYNEVNHTINMRDANATRNVRMNIQCEASNDYMCELVLPDTPDTAIVLGPFEWENMNSSQKIGQAVFKVTGTGSARFDSGKIRLSSLTAPYPAGKLFSDPPKISLRNFEIIMPTEDVLNAASEYAQYGVIETAFGRVPATKIYREAGIYSRPTFHVADGYQTGITIEAADTAASTVDNVAPLFELYRNNESSTSAVAVGGMRVSANNDATQTTLTVTGITKANPAVVTVDSGELTAASWSNGHVVSFGNLGGGMDGLVDGGFVVANINTGAGTFELDGVDSTGFSDFVAGATVTNARKRAVAGFTGYMEDDTAYAEYGRALIQAVVNGSLETVAYANRYGMFIYGNYVQTNIAAETDDLIDAGHAINTANKYAGKQVFNTTTGKPVFAVGSGPTAAWNDATGSTAHSPS